MATSAGRVVLTFEVDDKGVVTGLGRVQGQVADAARKLGQTDPVKQLQKSWTDFGRKAEGVGRTLTTAITLPLAGLATGAIKAAIDFEESFAGVAKTVDGVVDETGRLTALGEQLQQGFKDLSKEIPLSVHELNRIGEAAGQLGIKTENIIGFTDVMAKLGVATNLSSDQAATALARLANITQMPQSEFDRLGSTIVALGNNFATTESEIVEFGLRIAGAGAQVGMTEPQILAIGTALSSLGVEAEAGGTAVQKVILSMMQSVQSGGAKLEAFAATAGMTAEQFQRSFRDDAGAAFAAFVTGLGQQGQSAIGTLNELGLTDQRLIRSFLALAGSGDLLNRTMAEGTAAWKENVALQREADIRFKTTANQLKLLWNRVYVLAVDLGGSLLPVLRDFVALGERAIPVIDQAVQWFSALPEPVRSAAVGFGALLAAVGPATWAVGKASTAVGTMLDVMGMRGLATVTKFSSALTSLGRIAVPGVAAAFAAWHMAKWTLDLGQFVSKLLDGKMGLDSMGYSALTFGERMEAGLEAWKRLFTGGNLDRRDIIQSVLDQRNAVDESTQAVDRNADAWKKAYAAMGAAGERNRQAANAAEAARVAVDAAARSAEDKAKADAAAKKAAEELEKALNEQAQAMRSLGIPDVTRELNTLRGAMTAMARENVPMAQAARLVIERLKELREKAVAAGVSVKELDEQIEALRGTIRLAEGDAPRLTASIMSLGESQQILAGKVGMVTAEQMRAKTESTLLAGAFETLGMKSRSELIQIAEAARVAYGRMAAAGWESAEQEKAARQAVFEAEIDAGLRMVSAWEGFMEDYSRAFSQLGADLMRRFSDQLLGINSRLHEERRRAAEDARESFARTERDAKASLQRTEKAARDSYDRTVAAAKESHGRELESLDRSYRDKLEMAGGNEAAIQEIEIWYALERQRLEEESNAALVEAAKTMHTEIETATAESNTQIKESHDAMQLAIEEASHPWRDRMIEIWQSLKTGVKDILSQMLSEFLTSFLGGMLQGLNAWATQAGAIIGRVFGMASAPLPMPSFGGSGATTAAGAAAGAGAGSAVVAASLTAASVAPIAIPWALAAFGDHGNDAMATAQMEVDAFLEGARYQGLTVEEAIQRGFADGLSVEARSILGLRRGGIVDAGEGGLAVLHGQELVAPLPDGFDLAATLRDSASSARTMVGKVYLDGRELIRSSVRWVPDEADRRGAFARA